jgi:hypothetical protein
MLCLIRYLMLNLVPWAELAPFPPPPSSPRSRRRGILPAGRQPRSNTLLGQGTYPCSPRSTYRILQKSHEVRERRDELRHAAYK